MHFFTFQANIENIHRTSSDLQKSKSNVFLDNITDGQTINYHNVQTTNSLFYREFLKVGIILFSF